MTLANLITQPVSYDTVIELAIILTSEQATVLASIQEQYGNPQHIASPVALNDGRFMLCADLLTEVGIDGLYSQGFSHLPAEMFTQVDVIPMQEAIDLIPKQDQDI